jgi:hypothetical protein
VTAKTKATHFSYNRQAAAAAIMTDWLRGAKALPVLLSQCKKAKKQLFSMHKKKNNVIFKSTYNINVKTPKPKQNWQ